MSIRVWEYLREYEEERTEILSAVEKVLSSGHLILGPSVKAFEEQFAAYCDSTFGIGVDNATNGLMLALRALGVGPGDEVITVSNTAVPTVSAIVSAGATPRFVDIDPVSYLMDVTKLRGAITKKTKCLLPVHLYGQCVDMGAVTEIARQYGLSVVEDCAQAHGATQGGKKAGSFGDAAVFSFYPTKVLGAFGDGGAIVTKREDIASKLRRLRYYGMETTYYAEEHGYNSRLDELQAEILLRKLKTLDRSIQERRDIAAHYTDRLGASSMRLPHVAPSNNHVYYLYVIAHEERDRIAEELRKREIGTKIAYPFPVHTMRGYQNLGYREGDLRETEKAAKEILSLPMFPRMRHDEVDRVCDALLEITR